jgi:hypothetical protein
MESENRAEGEEEKEEAEEDLCLPIEVNEDWAGRAAVQLPLISPRIAVIQPRPVSGFESSVLPSWSSLAPAKAMRRHFSADTGLRITPNALLES